ncbi:high mobility group protein [Yamadazyma tenuis]|uniref:HMG box domain-containing protein n=1 Tax=Candida tenuis (strain ATCC 10573 / BCRC 21748 / CBS 615 / JCM 9827 / NBRC 10315 / NRRL Y-1498 / VKM Y-70) TaxID=590646 RepID=G3B853_CANTC|nr:uncharacterized protein CANTEDRAFT_115813 [Yamadazyma tenuis ATCC 10573]EGV62350.1 hypothetical protein CANTEDRAFT_115813 [Yamadazyma tenuis ATCC 10573]WEJ93617.1 high mobility group protein [Yamadazyma tenuis]
MSEVKAARDALVASLFELSKAAQDAAAATANLYKASHEGNTGNVDSLNSLSKAVNVLVSYIDVNGGADSKKPEKKKKPEKDPNAPKKPLTMYFAYSFHIREQIRDERKANGLPPLSAIEMNAYVKERWSKLSEAEKSTWQKKYQSELKVYQKQKEIYIAEKNGIKPPLPEIPIELPKDVVVESSDSSDSSSSESEVEVEIPEKKEKKDKKKKRKHEDKEKDKSEKKKKSSKK